MKKSQENQGESEIVVTAGWAKLRGILGLPPEPAGIVVFAHGSGSGRLSPRNTFVAQTLQGGGLATLLIDLLEEHEAEDRRKVFDIDLLADRLLAAAEWLAQRPNTQRLAVGYFGASTGAGAALQAAARSPALVAAVVSRGGRPDLAEAYLPQYLGRRICLKRPARSSKLPSMPWTGSSATSPPLTLKRPHDPGQTSHRTSGLGMTDVPVREPE